MGKSLLVICDPFFCELVLERPMRILPLTDSLAQKHASEAYEALNGDGTCTLSNMQTSCFAREFCLDGVEPALKLTELCRAPIGFVAIEGDDFAGCITCSGPTLVHKRYFPRNIPCDAMILSNLCVPNKYRGLGYGEQLCKRVIYTSPGAPLFLLVRRADAYSPIEMKNLFEEGSVKLMKYYERLDFEYKTSCPQAHLLFLRG